MSTTSSQPRPSSASASSSRKRPSAAPSKPLANPADLLDGTQRQTASDPALGSPSASPTISRPSTGTSKRPKGLQRMSTVDLSQTFMRHDDKKDWFHKRRLFFVLGGLLGAVVAYFAIESQALLDIQTMRLALAEMDVPSLSIPSLNVDLRTLGSFGINLTEALAPTREWFNNRDFQVGRDSYRKGRRKKHAVILVPGIVSSGLESWSTSEDLAPFFRKRIWGTSSMMRAIVTGKEQWIKAMTLDPVTGLDPEGVKVRSAQGLDAASHFVSGYWIWSKVIENLAVLDYDYSDLHLAAYDWRLSYGNLQERDKYFSRLKSSIEHNLGVLGKKTVLVSHSMGGTVALYFFKWVESPYGGNGGPEWVETHIESFVNVAGTLLGVPKTMAALLSGEMKDTVEMNQAAVALLERVFSRQDRAKLFRSWAGAASMWLKGGNSVWGTNLKAPDDVENATQSGGLIYLFRKPATEVIQADTVSPNLTLDAATTFLYQNTPTHFQRMLETNYSFGFERDPEQIARNDDDHRKWTNPLEVRLPNAPSMKIYCLYGWGKPTERAYWYRQEGFAADEPGSDLDGTCDNCEDHTPASRLTFPSTRRVYVDNSVNLENEVPPVRSGVLIGEGDGTVSLLSLGAMCVEGWKRDLYNPAKIPVVTHELKHEPLAFDPRGGPTTSDHIDILGATELNEAIMDIVSGHGDAVKDQYHSRIRDFAARIAWDAPLEGGDAERHPADEEQAL